MTNNIKILENYGLVRRNISIAMATAIKDLPLGHRQTTILRTLGRYGEMNLGALAIYTNTDAGTITRSVKQMLDQGLVEKTQSPEDGRHWLIRLSKKGQKHFPEITAAYEQVADVFVEGLTSEEREQFSALLEKIGTHLEKKNKTERSL